MSDLAVGTAVDFTQYASTRMNLRVRGEEFSNELVGEYRREAEDAVRSSNLELELQMNRQIKQTMGKDDFLKLLITQLQNQDPTKPMEDKEFIAQMAQFSSLEQMNNMTDNLQKLTGLLSSSQAIGVLGKEVTVQTNNGWVSGNVDEVSQGKYPQVLVEGTYYDYDSIIRVKN